MAIHIDFLCVAEILLSYFSTKIDAKFLSTYLLDAQILEGTMGTSLGGLGRCLSMMDFSEVVPFQDQLGSLEG